MRPLLVDDIMKKPVFTIDSGKTGEEALGEMDSKHVKKILVTTEGKPAGVLERWKITEVDRKLPIQRLELSPFQVVPMGTEVAAIQNYLRDFSAVYVSEPNGQNLVGVVTTYDLVQAY